MSRHYSAFVNDVLGTADATSVSEMIHRGDITLDEAIDAAIKRAQASRTVLNAVVIDDFERVKFRAKNLSAQNQPLPDRRRLNTPAFLKDNLHLEGLPTRFGSNATSPQPSAVTDDLVHQLHAAGLHFIGKSSTPPFGFGCSTEFDDGSAPTRNPWNLDLSAGGSSGGSAALVAAGVVPIAHGNDGGGSIRIPAALCGIVGLKPSRGRLIRQQKSKAMPIDIISDGVLTRTVRDTANFYHDAERYFQPKDLKPIGLVVGPSKKRLRIGFVYDSILTKACPQTRLTLDSTAKALSELGHMVEETTFQSEERFAQDFTLYWSFLAFMVDVFGKKMLSSDFDRKRLDGLTRGLSKNFKDHMWSALKAMRYLRNACNQPMFKTWRYDVILSPVLARTAPEIGYLNPGVPFDTLLLRLQEYVGYTPLANVIGNTAISLPMGQTTSGSPIGMQFSAPAGEERQLLELSFELENAKPWPFLYARSS